MVVFVYDVRDFEFVKMFDFFMCFVVFFNDGEEWDQEKVYFGDGIFVNFFYEIDINGLFISVVVIKVIQWLEQSGFGKKQVRGLIVLVYVIIDFNSL